MEKISWMRITVTVNLVVTGYLVYVVYDLCKLNAQLGDALVFHSSVFEEFSRAVLKHFVFI